jgi:hypothetical protein
MSAILPSVPPDILEKITDLLYGLSVIRLWRTGDKILQWKLSLGGGVRSVHFTETGVGSTSRYPHMLDNFDRLTSLTINMDNGRICDPGMLWIHLSRFSVLENLSLTCVEAEEWLMNSQDSLTDAISFLDEEWLPHEPFEPIPRLKPIASTFNHLSYLKLAATKSYLRDEDLADFPLSLTRLDLPINDTLTPQCYTNFKGKHLLHIETSWGQKYDSESVRKLPQSLTTINMTMWDAIEYVDYWPPNTTEIRAAMNGKSLQHLPMNLTRLELTNMTFGGSHPSACLTHLQNLKTLILRSYYQHDLNELPGFPSQLETLNLEVELSNVHPNVPNPSLPAGLLSLTIFAYMTLDEEKLVKMIPKGLTYLRVQHRNHFTGKLLGSLSQHLKHINIYQKQYGIPTYKPEAGLKNLFQTEPLSPFLTYLTIRNTGCITANAFAKLPQTIMTLELNILGEVGAETAHLPKYLSHATFHCADAAKWNLEAFENLPPHLHTFHLHSSKTTFTEEMVRKFSPTLKSLSLSGIHFHDDFVPLLPREITYFSWIGSPAVTSQSYIHLPRELRGLDTPDTPIINDKDIKDLPRYLTRWNIPHNATVTSACLPFLPPALKYLTADKHPLSPAFESSLKRRRNDPLVTPDPRILTNSTSMHNNRY